MPNEVSPRCDQVLARIAEMHADVQHLREQVRRLERRAQAADGMAAAIRNLPYDTAVEHERRYILDTTAWNALHAALWAYSAACAVHPAHGVSDD
jgi:cell division septum initiation protein DivIVA